MTFPTPAWDLELFRLVNDTWRSPFLDYAMPIMSYTPLIWILGLIAVALTLRYGYHNWKRVVVVLACLGIAVGMTDITCNSIKSETERMRPYHALAGAHYLTDTQWRQNPPTFEGKAQPSKTSFVSSHAANTMALTVMLMLLVPLTRPWLLGLPFAVGWSRLYLGKHYPTDILGGYIVGALMALLVWYGMKALVRYAKRRGISWQIFEYVV
ncbi:MAG: phosphatase PAP2 family protein [Pseudomonadota bacterium]